MHIKKSPISPNFGRLGTKPPAKMRHLKPLYQLTHATAQRRLLRALLNGADYHSLNPPPSGILNQRCRPLIPTASGGDLRSTRRYSAVASAVAPDLNVKGQRPFPNDIVLYQYEACPFCNKVKAFLDYYKIPYRVVEVNPISKKEIKWSDYKKVPIVTVEGGKQMNDSSAIIDEMFQRLHPGEFSDDVEENKWRGWVDNHLVHVLSPNIYRSPSEALESFDYITTHGNFSFMERLIAKYTGAAAMYLVAKKLKKKHNIEDERAALYGAAETWVDALQGRPYCGGVKPNLADLAVFGILRPIRHLQSGKDMVENTRIGEWYDRMQKSVGDSARIV